MHGVRYSGGSVVDTVDTRGTVNGRQIIADREAYDAILAAMRPPPVVDRCATRSAAVEPAGSSAPPARRRGSNCWSPPRFFAPRGGGP